MEHKIAALLSVLAVAYFIVTAARWAKKHLPGFGLAPPAPSARVNPVSNAWANPAQSATRQAASFPGFGQGASSASPFFGSTAQDPFAMGLGPSSMFQTDEIIIGPLYHGTGSYDNAVSIFQNGWLIGNGCAYGSGAYLTIDPTYAQNHVGSNGVVLTANIRARQDEIIDYDTLTAMPGCPGNGDGLTGFALSRGYKVVHHGGNYVVLATQS